ncbi:MAG: lasso peptide biosynthesis protein [Deltaproteobacteria bacterium]|nr:lasso peptide biosynthesis protein [Deltaproteobacteria bacterium]
MVDSEPPIWQWRRLRRVFRRPSDLWLSLRLGYFIWRVPHWVDDRPLPVLLQTLERSRRPAARDLKSSVERINRLSRPWFKVPPLRARNNCYVRSLMFYRFVDAPTIALRIHLVVEPRLSSGDRLRGHAWVSAGSDFCEAPQPEVLARAKVIYTYPDVA